MDVLKRSSKLSRTTIVGLGITLLVAATLVPTAMSSSPAFADASDTCIPAAPNTNCVFYTTTGADQTFTVPAGVTSVTARVAGAGGGKSARNEDTGGVGGLATGTIAVTGRQSLIITVGDVTGYGGGGTGGLGSRSSGGRGGGLSAIWSDASFSSSFEPYLLAGGGGGAAGAGGPTPSGGAGGGVSGGNGKSTQTTDSGGGGTATAGGANGGGSNASDGSHYQGGTGGGGADGGGGGGGGWFGGGGGHAQPSTTGANSDSGGGGGSGYIGAGVTDGSLLLAGGATSDTAGNVTLEWVAPAPTIVFPAPGGKSSTTPTITGTGVPGNTVTVTEGGVTICTAVVDIDGDWSCVPTSPLTAVPGGTTHTIVVTQTDDPSSPLTRYPTSTATTFTAVPLTTFTQPSVPRVGMGDSGTTGLRSAVGAFMKYVITAPTSTTITGYLGCTGGDYLLEIALDGLTATCTYTPSSGTGLTSNSLESLAFTVSASAAASASLAGSITVFGEDGGSRSFPFYVNTPPVIPVLTGPTNGSVVKTSTPPITGIGQDGDIITVTDENDRLLCTAIVTGGVWSCTPTVALIDGDHTFTPTAEDPDGNKIIGLPFTITVDTSEPIVPAASNSLPFTGTNSLPLIGTGLATLLLGASLLAISGIRRRRRA